MLTQRCISIQFRHANHYDIIKSGDLLAHVAADLRGKCSHGMFVVAAERILAQSPWQKINDTDFTGAQISLRVELSGYILPKGFIIPNCKITRVQNKLVIFENEYCHGICPLTDETRFLSEGLVAPFIVENADHIGGKIAVNAKLFSHREPWCVYKIISAEPAPEVIARLSARIAAATARLNSADPAAVERFFRKIICRGAGSAGGTAITTLPPVGKVVELNESLNGTWIESAKPYIDEVSAVEASVQLGEFYIAYIECFLAIVANCNSPEALRQYRGLLTYIDKSK
jgi:hypothetical protein